MPIKVQVIETGGGSVMLEGELRGSYTRANVVNALRTGQAVLRVVQESEGGVDTPPLSPLPSANVDDGLPLRRRRGQKATA